ncbi:bacteriorhodopsin [Promicromonospora panici]|uniref:bacteriorhodopsin n=1 Tax=Promicromonospora panici TaxID=2219658 RepID=UPI0013EDD06D|nr:bacteriorhodopsin [Promicromonospora panici]
MHALVIVIALGLPVLIVALVVLLVARRGGPPHDLDATVVAARRHETRISAVAATTSIVMVLALWVAAATWGEPGVLLGVAPFTAALTFSLARALGEARWPRPTGEVRSAPLVRRSLRDQGGWRLTLFASTVAGFFVVLVVFGLTAADDGRSVERVLDAGRETHSAGPYPGWAVGVPVLLVLALAVGATLVALRAVTRRPPIGLLPPEQDDAIRRTSAARELAGAQLWVGLGAAAYLAFAAGALLRVGWLGGGVLCLLLAVVAFVGSVMIAATALPSRRAGAADAVPRTATPGPVA